MNANELRLGNLVIIKNNNLPEVNNRISTVLGIQQREEKDFPDSDSVICFNCDGSWVNYYQLNEYIKPIPLTEEWLLKLGFDKLYYHSVYSQPNANIFSKRGYFIKHYKRMDVEYYRFVREDVTIKYVHQLQNLYFALTGDELEVK